MIDELDSTQYEMVELPSKGECYPHKKRAVKVGYLLASDENIIFSPKLRRERKIGETLLRRKVLDDDVNVDELCSGDREAILLWLRKTGYGNEYTVPTTKEVIDLSYLTYEEFNYFGDENGHFDYLVPNGDLIKYRILSHKEEIDLIMDYLTSENSSLSDETTIKVILEALIMQTVSINGNSNREYIRDYINNMPQEELVSYQIFVYHNTPKLNNPNVIYDFGDTLFYDIK